MERRAQIGTPSLPSDTPAALRAVALTLDQLGTAYLCDTEGRLIAATKAYRELMDVPVDTGGVPSRHFALCGAVLRTGRALEGLERYGRGFNARRLLVRHLPIRDPDGLVAGVLGLFSDGTALADDEELATKDRKRLQDFIRASADWAWETDRGGNIIFVSDRIVDVLGVPPPLLHGHPLSELGHPLIDDDPDQDIGTLVIGQKPFRAVETIVVDPKDRPRHFLFNGVPVFDDTGAFTGFRGTATDATETREAEARLSAAHVELENAHAAQKVLQARLEDALLRATNAARSKRQFLATMSHELRTPLNAIIGFSALMLDDLHKPSEQKQREYAEDIASAGNHLLSLIDDLLDMARIEQTQLRLELSAQPVKSILLEARSIVQARRRDRDPRINIDVAPEDLTAMVDRTRLIQILINLLDNAVCSGARDSAVAVEAKATPGHISIDIVDRGPGLPSERASSIFDAFSRQEPSEIASDRDGLGIGLSISRSLARLMSGDLELVETGRHGSRFRVVLQQGRL